MAAVASPGAEARAAFDVLAAELLRQPNVERRRLFGRDGLRADGKYFAFLDGDRLVVHLQPERTAALLASGEGEVGTSLSPSMRKWLAVPFSAEPPGRVRWAALLADAQAYVSAVRG